MKKIRLFLPLLAVIAVIYLASSHDWSAESGLPRSYSAKNILVTVLDASSGTPLPNSAVVAQWVMVQPNGYKGASWYKALYIAEAITDQNGHASITEWGPKRIPSGWQMENGLAPKIIVIRPGYAPEYAYENLYLGSASTTPEQSSQRPTSTEVTVRLNTYETEIATKHNLSMSNPERFSQFSSPLDMWQFLSGQLNFGVFGAESEETAIASQWNAIVMADNELQRLSAPSIFRWRHPKVEKMLADQRMNTNRPNNP